MLGTWFGSVTKQVRACIYKDSATAFTGLVEVTATKVVLLSPANMSATTLCRLDSTVFTPATQDVLGQHCKSPSHGMVGR